MSTSSFGNMEELLTQLCWNAMQHTYCNGQITHLLPTLDDLTSMICDSGLEFCTDLLDVLQSSSPPPLEWLLCHPAAIPSGTWGVYLLVLEKPGYKPCIYVGSGTALTRGVCARLKEYERRHVLPGNVSHAFDIGFTITHRFLVAWCPIPPPEKHLMLRAAFLAMEGVFTHLFGAFQSRWKSYGFENITSWPVPAFEWLGLCTHSSLLDPVRDGSVDFTAEELKEIAAAAKQRAKDHMNQYQKNLRANPTPEYLERRRGYNAVARPKTRIKNKEAIASRQYPCDACDLAFRDRASLVKHEKSPRHVKQTLMGDEYFECLPCDIAFRYKSDFETHTKTAKHERIAAGLPAKLDNPNSEHYRRVNAKYRASTLQKQQFAIANKLFHCEPCNKSLKDKGSLARHEATDRHQKKLIMGDDDFRCEPCNRSFKYLCALKTHLASQLHQKAVLATSSVSST